MQHFTRKLIPVPNLCLDNANIQYKVSHRVLGMILDSPKLTWKPHIQYLINDCQRRLDILKIISSPVWGASLKMLRMAYISYIRSKIAFGCILYNTSKSPLLKKLDVVQNNALRLILGARRTSPILSLQAEAHIPPLSMYRGQLVIKNYIKLISKPSNFRTKKSWNLINFCPTTLRLIIILLTVLENGFISLD